MRHVLCIQFSLIWTFIQWCFEAGRGFYHFFSLAEWSLYSFQVFQAFLLNVIHVMRHVLCIQFSLIWTFIQWCFEAGRGFYHFFSLAEWSLYSFQVFQAF